MTFTPEQRSVIQTALKVAQGKKASPRERKALLEALSVESNFRDLPGGDRDSVGALQQRPSQGWGPASESLSTDVAQFLQRAQAVNRSGFHGSAGQLAQAVQRSAFPGRYDQRSGQVSSILRGLGGDVASLASGSRASSVPSTRTVTVTPAVDNTDARRQALASFLLSSEPDPVTGQQSGGDILSLAMQMRQLQDQPAVTKTVTGSSGSARAASASSPSVPSRSGGSLAEAATARANVLDSKHLPYLWGGGHQGRILNVKDAKPLDCSGAVSAVLGINPRVSGEFTKWGRPGDGGSKGVTVAANAHHVLMKINGHWFGTSATNPGGGAGWIPQSAISPEYLKGFTLRHSEA